LPLLTRCPLVQPLQSVILPAPASKTCPVTPLLSAEHSQATSGDTLEGSMGSNVAPSRRGGPRASVRRVRAAGAMALTVTPKRSTSCEATTVNAAMRALAAA
jgi:hypothetical protein